MDVLNSSTVIQKDPLSMIFASQKDMVVPAFSTQKDLSEVVLPQSMQSQPPMQIQPIQRELEQEKEERIKLQSKVDQHPERMNTVRDNLCKMYVDLGNIITSMSNTTTIIIGDEKKEVASDEFVNFCKRNQFGKCVDYLCQVFNWSIDKLKTNAKLQHAVASFIYQHTEIKETTRQWSNFFNTHK
ncbi:hypothetical protein FDP41_001134 [Naegleria fowleri]|uniref:Uncharacterized protein n=1 Tax=Naegleria fowleri TaxID=5763 RepID=A0A6A5BZI0_NAEFO|nr:uncharacterized protein FDP41_001134 [Naegleria fowleri]KAF0979981.1 hypothetical protein FDP41_001134 [Naegleria fowleri]